MSDESKRDCVHHWVLAPQGTPLEATPGTCKRCGASRTFDPFATERADAGGWRLPWIDHGTDEDAA